LHSYTYNYSASVLPLAQELRLTLSLPLWVGSGHESLTESFAQNTIPSFRYSESEWGVGGAS